MASMSASWRLALNNLTGERWRTALMIGTVALATALVVAVSCAIASVQAGIEHALIRFLGASDARIVHPFNGRFDETILDAARSWDGVVAATGRFGVQITLTHVDSRKGLDPETEEPRQGTPNVVGVEFDLVPRFRVFDDIEGVLPESPDQLLLDDFTAAELQASVGDVLNVSVDGLGESFTVAGIYRRQKFFGTTRRGLIEMDLHALQRVAGFEGKLTSIYLILDDDIDPRAFCDSHQDEMPEQVSLEPSDLVRSGFDRQIRGARLGMLAGSILTFVCASFIIVTGLTTSLSARQREMAIIRCVGGSRGQLFSSQLLFGVILSGLGIVIGLPMGIAFAGVLVWYYRDSLPAGFNFSGIGLSLSVLGALGAGLLGAMYPAFLASRIPPMQAMTARGRPASIRMVVSLGAIGLALCAVQVALFQIPDPTRRFEVYAYVGIPALHLGAFLLAVPLLYAVTRLIAPILSSALRLPAGMVGRSVLGTPYRNGFTAGALMVGVSILVSSWSNNLSLLNHWIQTMQFADGIAFRVVGITETQRETIESMPFVTRTCPLRYLPLRIFNRQVFGLEDMGPRSVKCFSTDVDVFFEINAVRWIEGDPETALERLKRGEGILVADRFTIASDLGVGDVLTLGSGSGKVQHDYEILGVIDAGWLEITAQLFGMRNMYMDIAVSGIFMDGAVVAERYGVADIHFLQVEFADDVDTNEASKAIRAAAPGIMFWTSRDVSDRVNEIAYTTMAIQSTIALAALVLASLAVGNVILANIRARKHEFGVLRAVGGMRWLLVRLILAEATIIAVTAATTGTLLGMHLAWVGAENYRELAGLAVQLVFPTIPTLIAWGVVIVLTLIAALPGVWSVVRPRPATLIAGGRNG